MKNLLVAVTLMALSVPALAQEPARDSTLCWSQLELLQSRNRLLADEAAVFEAQCRCLEANEEDGGKRDCAAASD